MVIIAIIGLLMAQRLKPIGCNSQRYNWRSMTSTADLSNGETLTPHTINKLHKLASVGLARKIDRFSLLFSPDSSMLGISGLGWNSAVYLTVYLWRFKGQNRCLWEGQILPGGDTQAYQAFSPDSQFVIISQCRGWEGRDCHTLWDTRDNHFLRGYYDAKFIQQGNDIIFAYQRTADAPLVRSNLRWPIDERPSSNIDILISGDRFKLIDSDTGRTLRIGHAAGQILYATMSPDQTLLALAVVQPPDEEGYPWPGFVELWGVLENSTIGATK